MVVPRTASAWVFLYPNYLRSTPLRNAKLDSSSAKSCTETTLSVTNCSSPSSLSCCPWDSELDEVQINLLSLCAMLQSVIPEIMYK